jgi:SAM-dependent methyltransferase
MPQFLTAQHRWQDAVQRYDRPHLRLRQVAAVVNAIGPDELLDIGCSAGHLRTLCPGITYRGVDFIEPTEPPPFDFTRCDLNREPLPERFRELPMIVCCGSLEYVERLPALLETIGGRLRVGGTLVATYFNMNHVSRIAALARGRTFPTHPDWRGFYAPSHVRRLIEKVPLRIDRVIPTTHAWSASPPVEKTVDRPTTLPRLRPWSRLTAHQFIVVATRER